MPSGSLPNRSGMDQSKAALTAKTRDKTPGKKKKKKRRRHLAESRREIRQETGRDDNGRIVWFIVCVCGGRDYGSGLLDT